ncbi:alpha/beta hydrolase [Flavimarina sp. Hel_I_48]|uniref:alpha/beta hydrolase n=1 Tax=Flavimarina sp. Hel_I_48 TaxID=1392488 RepID=UPI00068AE974|nr:alpha/beta hydrolase-fold protein [Flavimarina sp. Hel_I_48]
MHFHINHISIKGCLYSDHLERTVDFRLFAPPTFWNNPEKFPVLLMNDGQDFEKMELEKTLSHAFASEQIKSFIYVGISAGNRLQEYGTAGCADFKGRGARAEKYSRFILKELIPFLKKEFNASHEKADWVFCGMSLGGLNAFDIGFNNPDYFDKIGVFSGSFWWRKKPYIKGDMVDRSRIVLDMVKNAEHDSHLKFWFQCGSQDERADRNDNGIIDSIDDTLDLVKELQTKGYSFPGDITYVQVEGGKHDLPTWAKVFPEFLRWAFGEGD